MTDTKRLTIPAAEELLGLYFPVLDHGYVALVDYMGGDEAIDQAARTSYGAGTRKVTERRGLMRTLKRNRHSSPYEMVEIKLHCAMPIFVARQWVRHRMASLNEYSARYSVMPMLFYIPDADVLGKQSVNNKQGRGEPLEAEQFAAYLDSVHRANEAAEAEYALQITMGVARETARGVLPVSVYTQWYWKTDLHNMFHMLGLRCDPHAQLEFQSYANIIAGIVKRIAPNSFEAWVDYEFCGARFSRMEMNVLRKLLTHMNYFPSGDQKRPEPCALIHDGVGGGVSIDEMVEHYGMSKREIAELFAKLFDQKNRPVPSFELDLSLTKSPEFFADKWAAAVPKVDREK